MGFIADCRKNIRGVYKAISGKDLSGETIVVPEDKIKRVERTKKGRFIHYKGNKYPMAGWFDVRVVMKLASFKFLLPLVLKIIRFFVRKHILKNPNEYSKSVRETYRVFNILIAREKSKRLRKNWELTRDVICMILEHDDAYRFRFQDMLPEFNMKEIKLTKADKYYFRPKPYWFKDKFEKNSSGVYQPKQF